MSSFVLSGKVITYTKTNTAYLFGMNAISIQKLPTDPLFFADVSLVNIVPDSKFWIAVGSDLLNVLALGQAISSTVTISGVPVYENPMLIEIRVRSSSGFIKYRPLKTYGLVNRDGGTVYISQSEVEI